MRILIGLALLALTTACARPDKPMEQAALEDFAARYTAAWRSQDAASVAALFAGDGTLTINDGPPATGREAITNVAQEFMSALPDLVLMMDSVRVRGEGAEYWWTLTGTNTAPGGTGNAVWVSGSEEWTFTPEGLIAQSLGHFPTAEYEYQLRGGALTAGAGTPSSP